jgi:hypothetical protein
MTWYLGAQQSQPWQTKYFAILNAWSVLLGCTLNRSFVASEDTFDRAAMLIQLVAAGRADWRLIYAFLKCIEFVEAEYIPGSERWFPVPVSVQEGPSAPGTPVGVMIRPRPIEKYTALDSRLRVVGNHNDSFVPSDGYNDHDISVKIPHRL